MKPWKVVPIVFLLPGLAGAQSLGEAAAKEKERRKKTQQSGTPQPRVITNEDLPGIRGAVANHPGSSPAPETTSTGSSGASESSSAGSEPDRKHEEAEWRRRVAQATARVESAKKSYEYFNSQSLVPGEYFVDENGKPVITSVQQLRALTAKAKAEWDAAQKALDDLLESARRAGIPPGWLR